MPKGDVASSEGAREEKGEGGGMKVSGLGAMRCIPGRKVVKEAADGGYRCGGCCCPLGMKFWLAPLDPGAPARDRENGGCCCP